MKKYLIIGVHPTPNGPLHLGHVAGPFLTLDIFHRCKKILGYDVFFISGTDSYEEHVSLKAFEENIQEYDVAQKYSDLILKDLYLLNIDLDTYLPLHNNKESYFYYCQSIVEKILKSDSIIKKNEIFPYDLWRKRYLSGGWLQGVCYLCGEDTGGFYCENCGGHHQPDEIYPHRFKYTDESNIIYLMIRSLFLMVTNKEVLKNIKGRYSNYTINMILSDILSRKEIYLTRLTLPSTFGPKIICPEKYFNVAFSYTVGLAAFYLMCGDVYASKCNGENAFNVEDVKIVTAYGFDNISAYLMGMEPILQKIGYKKLTDINFVNKFLLLNGSKFSTSRNHALWVRHLVEQKVIHSDLLRLIMALNCPDKEVVDFSIETIAGTLNEFVKKWNAMLYRVSCLTEWTIGFDGLGEFLENFQSICEKDKNISRELSLFILDMVNNSVDINDNCIFGYFLLIMYVIYPIMPSTSQLFFNDIMKCNNEYISRDVLFSLYSCENIYKKNSSVFCELFFEEVDKMLLTKAVGVK
ncbi:TPA: class I tRNA ligase family protein [Salmonella enterica]|nr:class I tRNA ligase family protein [Salmonella enterica]